MRKEIKELINLCMAIKHEDVVNEIIKDIDITQLHIINKRNYTLIVPKGVNIPFVLINAHTDTVHLRKPKPKDIFISLDGSRLTAETGIGGDDRCGCWIVKQLLKDQEINKKIIVLLTDLEESGGIGVEDFLKEAKAVLPEETEKYISFIMGLDRKGGKDIVIKNYSYNFTTQNFLNFLRPIAEKHKRRFCDGSYSDFQELAVYFKRCAVNIGVGYHRPHTTEEIINIREMEQSLEFVKEVISKTEDKIFKKTYRKPKKRTVFKNWDDYFTYEWERAKQKAVEYERIRADLLHGKASFLDIEEMAWTGAIGIEEILMLYEEGLILADEYLYLKEVIEMKGGEE